MHTCIHAYMHASILLLQSHTSPFITTSHTTGQFKTHFHQFPTLSFLADLGDFSAAPPSSLSSSSSSSSLSSSHARFLPPFLPLGVIGIAAVFSFFALVDGVDADPDAFLTGDGIIFSSSPAPAAAADIPRTFAIRCVTALGVTPNEAKGFFLVVVSF